MLSSLSSSSSSNVNRKRIVLCSPHQKDQFVVGSGDVKLYEINSSNSTVRNIRRDHNIDFDIEYPPDNWLKEDKKSICLKSVNADIQYLKCMAWGTDSTLDQNLIACGLVNGRTVLTSFSSVNRIVKEFTPKHNRPCNAIAWNPVNKQYIAVGLDKVRGDCSTLVWDVNFLGRPTTSTMMMMNGSNNSPYTIDAPHQISQINSNSFSTTPIEQTDTISQTISEYTLGEATMSLAWIPSNPYCLVIGTGSKYLRIYDTRDTNTSHSIIAHPKTVAGVAIDPFDNNRLATMSEDGIVKIWDMRRFDEPINNINTGYKAVQQFEWCPTRSGILATSGKEKNTIKLWDLKTTPTFTLGEYSHSFNTKSPKSDRKSNTVDHTNITKPTKIHLSSEIISSFSWHPTNECRMLTVSYTGVVEILSLNENIPISWSPHGTIGFSFGKDVVEGPTKGNTIEPNLQLKQFKDLYNDGRYNKDISLLMKERAIQGYSANIEDNYNLSNKFSERDIHSLWGWMQRIPSQLQQYKKKPADGLKPMTPTTPTTPQQLQLQQQLLLQQQQQQQQHSQLPKDNDYIGIQNILTDPNYIGPNTTELIHGFLVYKSTTRSLCSLICGWGFSPTNQPLEIALLRLEKIGEFEKAAALAVFNLDIKRAIAVAQNGCPILASQHLQQAMSMMNTSQNSNNNNINMNNSSNMMMMMMMNNSQNNTNNLVNSSNNFNSFNNNNQSINNSYKDRENKLRVLSIALAGFGDGSSVNSLWKETCRMTGKTFTNPYLKLCLDFLSLSNPQDSKEIMALLNESSISLADKIGIACRHLDQADLISFIDKQTALVVESGDLQGIVLTGLTPRGVDLFQHYIDKSSDVQTAALAMCVVVPRIFRDKRATKWLSIYSDLLDNWACWHERAMLDISRVVSIDPPPSQIYAKCGYCQNSFAFDSVNSASMAGRNTKVNARAKVPCCPHCKQSLPRCCLCMLQMNCMVPGVDFKKSINKNDYWTEGAEPFDEWFSWCQSCRHGGHASHIAEWFKDHNECPVTDCTCKCSLL